MDEISQKLQALMKYIPFINYLIERDEQKYGKFEMIRTWIIAKKRYPMRDLEKMEQSFFVQFKNLFLENVKIPIEISDIFKKTPGEIKCINLCSDEEEDDDNDTAISVAPILSGITNTEVKLETSETLFKRRGDFRPEVADTNLKDMNLDELQVCMENCVEASNIPINTFLSVLRNSMRCGESDAVQNPSTVDNSDGRVTEQEFTRQTIPTQYKINPKDPRLQKILERGRSKSSESYSKVESHLNPSSATKITQSANALTDQNLSSNDVPKESNDMHLLMHTLKPHVHTINQLLDQSKISPEKCSMPAGAVNVTDKNKISQAKDSKADRVLKKLECTVTGFNNPSATANPIPRRSSISARMAISEQYKDGLLSGSENDYSQANQQKGTTKQIRRKRRVSTRGNNELRELIRDIDEHEANELEKGTAKGIGGKRRCSISARNAISEQLRDQLSQEYTSEEDDAASLNSNITKLLLDIKKKGQPVVRLTRLTAQEVLKYTRPLPTKSSCDEVGLELLVTSEKRVQESPERMATNTKQTRIERRNNDVEMTERNTRFCVLCKAKPHNMTNHYIRSHKTESYVSRFRSYELRELKRNTPLAVAVPACGRITKYKMTCSFCNMELIDTFPNFYQHISSHTGEYAFQCMLCKFQKPYRADIQSHQLNSKGCRNSRIQTVYQYHQNITAINIYYCNICNFVQINEANVAKHVIEQHDRRLVSPEYVCKCTFVAMYIEEEDAQQVLSEDNASLPVPADDTVVDAVAECSNRLFDIPKSDCGVVVGNEADAPVEDLLSMLFQEVDDLVELQNTLEEPAATATTAHLPLTVIHCNPLPIEQVTKRQIQFEHRPLVTEIDVKPDLVELQNALHKEDINTRIQYRMFPADTHYFGLFKCMASDCFYSTDLREDMLQHFKEHTESECPPLDMLNCAYCPRAEEYATVQLLLDHIYRRHKHSRYQCPKCCYRSLAAGNVSTHCQLIHTEVLPGDDVVYECSGKMTSVTDRLPMMMMHMSEKVMQLRCAYCMSGSFAIESLVCHIRSAHPSASPMDHSLYPQYTCLYCGVDGHSKNDMQEHLAMQHPDEYAFACERVLKRGLEFHDAVQNLQMTNLEVLPLRIVEMLKWRVDSNAILTALHGETNTKTPGLSATNSTEHDQKPNLSDLLQINVEVVKPLLLKLTRETGISPDLIYCCSHVECGGFFSLYSLWARHMSLRHQSLLATCPHCSEGPIELCDFVTHFEQHRRHLYVCFHCDNTFVSETELNSHGTRAHAEIAPFRMEQITGSVTFSYGVLIAKQLHADRLEFLLQLQKVLQQHLRIRTEMKFEKLPIKWPVSATEPWLGGYPNYNLQRFDGCLVKKCPYRTQTDESLFRHLRSIHPIPPQVFECYKCAMHIRNQNWDQIIEHLQLHTSSIYVCCACSYTRSDRREVSEHIRTTHSARDVPLLSLFRSTTENSVAVTVVFATQKRTFSTMTECFCCSESNISSPMLALHLKRAHDFKLCYFCEVCNALITDLNLVDGHYAIAHGTQSIRLSCRFGLDRGVLSIVTVVPLHINITSGISVAAKKRRQIDQITSEARALPPKRPIINVGHIKTEHIELDEEIVLLEHDDVVIDAELKACRNKSVNDLQAKVSQIKCVNVTNLLKPVVPDMDAYPVLPLSHGHNGVRIEKNLPRGIRMKLNPQRKTVVSPSTGQHSPTIGSSK